MISDLQLKDPGADKPGYELDDLVDDMEDFYSRLQVMDYCIPLEDLSVSRPKESLRVRISL